MIIGIDVSMLVYVGSGVATYTYELVKQLLLTNTKNEYRLFYSSWRKPERTKRQLKEFKQLGAKTFNYPLPPWALKLIWNKWQILPVEWLIGKVDWYFSSDFLRPPLLPGTKGITTIHDLTWKLYPEFHTGQIVVGHERKLKKTIEGNDLMLVDSFNTKADLVKLYPVLRDSNKILVVYPGVSGEFKPIYSPRKIATALSKYKLEFPADYLLYVGAIEPRKNLEKTVRLFSELIKEAKYKNYRFLIVGRAGWKNESLYKQVKDLGLEKQVLFVGYVQEEDLAYFYNAAKVLIYLSEYEGFGLPPVEAARCGTPSLLNKNSSLKELFKGYEYALKGSELFTLKKMLTKKLSPVLKHDFSWEKTAKKFLDIIYEA